MWFVFLQFQSTYSLLQFYKTLTFPFSTFPSKHHSNSSRTLIRCHGNICSYSLKSHMNSRKYVPPTANRYINIAPIITGKIASPLVFNACPYTRFVTLQTQEIYLLSTALPQDLSFCVIRKYMNDKMSGHCKCAEKHVAVIRPYITAFRVPLSHSSNSFAPILQPVIIALACASAGSYTVREICYLHSIRTCCNIHSVRIHLIHKSYYQCHCHIIKRCF